MRIISPGPAPSASSTTCPYSPAPKYTAMLERHRRRAPAEISGSLRRAFSWLASNLADLAANTADPTRGAGSPTWARWRQKAQNRRWRSAGRKRA